MFVYCRFTEVAIGPIIEISQMLDKSDVTEGSERDRKHEVDDRVCPSDDKLDMF